MAFWFASGQVALDPRSNQFLAAIFASNRTGDGKHQGSGGGGGSNLHHIVKANVFERYE